MQHVLWTLAIMGYGNEDGGCVLRKMPAEPPIGSETLHIEAVIALLTIWPM